MLKMNDTEVMWLQKVKAANKALGEKRDLENHEKKLAELERVGAVVQEHTEAMMRTFQTGATRDTDSGKLDYEGFLSPQALVAFAEYMHKNRIQSDGSLRSSDNWQKGIPQDEYIKSAWRHFMAWWGAHRDKRQDREAICGLLFNAMGYLHESIVQGKHDG
jgi:hypothetical protein